MDVTVVVGVIAAAAAILSAVVSAQRVPAHIRELEKLALAAGAVDAAPETRRLLDVAIREAIPEPRIRSIWPEVVRVAAFGAGGAALGLLVLAATRAFQGYRWELIYPDFLIAGALLVLMPLLVRAREGVLRALVRQRAREGEWRTRVIAEAAAETTSPAEPETPAKHDG